MSMEGPRDAHITGGSEYVAPADQSKKRPSISNEPQIDTLVQDNLLKPENPPTSLRDSTIQLADVNSPKYGHSLNKVQKFFIKCPVFKNCFSKQTREDYKEYKEITLTRLHNYSKARSYAQSLTTEAKSEEGGIKKAGMLKLPSSLFIKKAELNQPKHPEIMSKIASEGEQHNSIADTDIAGIGTMKAYRWDNDTQSMQEKGVIPTSFINAKPNEADHLVNAYVIQVPEKEGTPAHAIIRSGVIDTEQKAKEFEKLVRASGSKRVVSHQLNSFEHEKSKITNQHYQLAQVSNNLKNNGIDLVHINTPSNRWYDFSKKLPNFLQKYTGEHKSRMQNLDSWGTYVGWLASEAPKIDEGSITDHRMLDEGRYIGLIGTLNTQVEDLSYLDTNELVLQHEQAKLNLKKYKNDLKNGDEFDKNEVKARLKEAKEWVKETAEDLKNQRAEKRKALEEIDQTIGKLILYCEELKPYTTDYLRKLLLMRKVLGAQLEIPGRSLHRGEEGMAIMMLNEELGVTGAMNCKSGLDRTGLWHAIKLSMETLRDEKGVDREFDLIKDWDKTTAEITRMTNLLGHDKFYKWLNDDPDLPYDLNMKPINREDLEKLQKVKQQMRDAVEFRNTVLNHLVSMGIPITFRSTGLVGIKWNKGISENLIPLNFLPRFVEVPDEQGNPRFVELVKYDERGKPSGITAEGSGLLTQFSELRKS